MHPRPPHPVPPEIMRKVSRRIFPIILAGYFIAILDRSNVAVAALTMNERIGLTAAQYGLGAGLFFLTYVALEIPSNAVLAKVGARAWLARIMITWGVVAAAMAFVSGPGSFYALRLLLGAAEAGFLPGVIFYLARWYPAEYRGRAFGTLLLAAPLAGVISAPLGGQLLRLDGLLGLDGWQWLFLLEAAPAVVLGFVLLRHLSDDPRTAPWLADDERRVLLAALDTGSARSGEPREDGRNALGSRAVWAVLLSPVVLTFAVIGFLLQANTTGLQLWMPSIMKSAFGAGTTAATLLAAVPYLVAALAAWAGGRLVDRRGGVRPQIIVPCLLAAAGMTASVLVGGGAVGFALLAFGGGVVTWAFPAFWKICSQLTTGAAAAVSIALINATGSLAGFAMPWIIGEVRQRTDSFSVPMYLISGGLVLAAVLCWTVSGRIADPPVGPPRRGTSESEPPAPAEAESGEGLVKTAPARARKRAPRKENTMVRINVPEGEDPMAYVMSKAGSPTLNRHRAESMAAQYDNESTLSPRERELCRMLMAHMMGCNHCRQVRMWRDRPGFCEEPIPESFYANVLQYASAPDYTERERLAAEFCERHGGDHLSLAQDEDFWERMHAAFGDEEIVDLCIMAGTWEAGRRMFQVLQVDGMCGVPAADGEIELKMPRVVEQARRR
ncbi:MFS transporter [Actinomadura rugatobispora]|uniref:MFS transporter n=1 Tax=Actinomadura rugatobispora TaxID=1994 RepID=A0ABW0ZSL8_9ACTN|nr:hypothetical protein GCM10010200_001640 [Actinomadura rugatobispora]